MKPTEINTLMSLKQRAQILDDLLYVIINNDVIITEHRGKILVSHGNDGEHSYIDCDDTQDMYDQLDEVVYNIKTLTE